MKIKKITAREILDSRGEPTVEATVVLENGISATASVPSGTSTGSHEALELRDNDEMRYFGKGVLKAVENVKKEITPHLVGKTVTDQEKIDQIMIELDGTENKKKLGANAILSVSMAVFKAGAKSTKKPIFQYAFEKYELNKKGLKIPVPIFVMFSGGKHGIGYLDFQEFLIIPGSSKTYSQGLQLGEEIYKTIGRYLQYRKIISSVGCEGAYTPNIHTNRNALEFIAEASKESKYQLKKDFFLGLDVAASSFYKNGLYRLKNFPEPLSTNDLIKFYQNLNKKHSFLLLEDPLYEDDWDGWVSLTNQMGASTMIVGDDLLCTNKKRVEKAIKNKACAAILVKPNQIGTISETAAVIKLANESEWKVIVSHRSGETNDDFIADFAVGVGAGYVKFGAPARGERVAKYNRLLKIEEELK